MTVFILFTCEFTIYFKHNKPSFNFFGYLHYSEAAESRRMDRRPPHLSRAVCFSNIFPYTSLVLPSHSAHSNVAMITFTNSKQYCFIYARGKYKNSQRVTVLTAAIPTICGTKFFGHHIAALFLYEMLEMKLFHLASLCIFLLYRDFSIYLITGIIQSPSELGHTFLYNQVAESQ